MDLPQVNATYAESYGFMTRNPNGFWRLDQIDPDGKRALFTNLSYSSKHQWKYGTILPDGRITTANLKPHHRYIRVDERLIPHKGGDVAIEGEFPDFRTTQGLRVWLDFDRSMTTYPVDFIARLEAYRRGLDRASRIKKRLQQPFPRVIKRATRRIITRLPEGGYTWLVEIDKWLKEGRADTRIEAERSMKAFERDVFGTDHRAKNAMCSGPDCINRLDNRRAGARFCSNLCRTRYHRKRLDNSTQ